MPNIVHHFTTNGTRSICQSAFWTGPRGDVSDRLTKCKECEESK